MARNSCFLCCFGRSGSKRSMTVAQSDNKKSWFRLKESASRKTVPLDSSTEKAIRQSHTQIHTSNSKLKWFTYKLKRRRKQSYFDKQTESFSENPIIVEVAPDQETRHGRQQNITENRKSFDYVDGTCQKRPKMDAIETGLGQPGSPDVKSKSGRNVKLSQPQSVSLLAPTREKGVNPPSKRRSRRQNHEPVVGLSILMVTLVILIIWGRTCAILCTSAWFYFLSRFKSTNENMVKSSGSDPADQPDLDLNSVEYKKRVVLEGFLERNNHRAAF